MLRETRSNRIRDTRQEVDQWLVERMKAKKSRKAKGGTAAEKKLIPPIAISESELADLLGFDRDTVRVLMRRQVPAVRVGKCWRYQVRDIVSWMVQMEMEVESVCSEKKS